MGQLVAHTDAGEQIAAQEAAEWRNADAGFLGAMDFSKAFGHESVEALEASGWPTRLKKLGVKVWLRQERFVAYDGHTDRNRLQSAAAHLPPERTHGASPCANCGSREAPNGYDSISNAEKTKTTQQPQQQ